MKNKRHKHHEEHIDETWLIPYADLLTLLLALFIILFASSQLDSKKYDQIMHALSSAFSGGTGLFEQSNVAPIQPAPNVDKKKEDEKNKAAGQSAQSQTNVQSQVQDLRELQKQLEAYIRENGLSTQLETKLTEDMLKITIRDHALFQSGSANIKPEAQKLAAAISNMLSSYANHNVEVAGYTDNRPISTKEFETNWDLSAKRSLNFMKILIQNKAIDPSRYRAIGYGEYQPIDSNDTEEGRSKNRRVEVNIARQFKTAETKSIAP